jgi:ABC-type uncharacterized transport system ATPase subunit
MPVRANSIRSRQIDKEQSVLERLSFGASAAENEFRELAGYYLDTDQFQRALRGEVRLVVGRKGSGKTAIFAQVRDRIRPNSQNIVVDLRPDGYQLIKFKEMVLKYLGAGALEHTVLKTWGGECTARAARISDSRVLASLDDHRHDMAGRCTVRV